MNELQINLLGPPEILWEGQHLRVKRRLPRTLLYYLATQKNFVGRRTLLTLFWENATTTFAKRRLREALSRIRTDLPDPRYLLTHSDLVSLDHDRVIVDQIEFNNLLSSIGNKPWTIPPDKPLPTNTIREMNHATQLWHGSQFLEGADIPSSHQVEDWLQQTNHQLIQMRTRLHRRLSNHYRAIGYLEEALKCIYQALESDVLNQDLHFQVLSLLVEMELYQEAKRYYSYITELLIEELDSYPSQQLVSIYRQIQSETLPINPSSHANWRILASLQTPFVGRKEEFRRMQRALQDGGGVIISGESGIGKTRFVQEFCEMYASKRRIMVSPARQTEDILPYQPIIELLRQNVQTDEWKGLATVWAKPLAVILPELLNIHNEIPSPGYSSKPELFRSNLFEALRQIFLLITEKNDLIIFIDDAHWADNATLSTIAYLIERPPFTKNALFILSIRSDENHPDLESLVNLINTPVNSGLIELPRLSFAEISSLVRYVLGYPMSRELIAQIEVDTGGNPFFILETLRTVQELETNTAYSNQPKPPITKSVYSLIQKRIDKLSPAARETLEFAAVIGTEFDPELISIASQQNIVLISRSIEELKQRHLIEMIEHPPQIKCCRFIHDIIRETLLNEVSSVKLRILHEKIAQGIESQLNSQPRDKAGLLAYHYESAVNLPATIYYWILAGRWARRLYTPVEANQIFTHAEDLILQDDDSLKDEIIHDLYADWTELTFELGDADGIRRQNMNLLNLGKKRNSLLLIGSALDGLSDACMVENRFEEGLEFTNKAINYLNHTEHVYEMMDTQIHRGAFLYMLGNINEAIQSFQLALSHFDQGQDQQVERAKANAHYQLGLSLTLSGWPKKGLNHAQLSLDLAKRLNHHYITVTAHAASSLAYYYLAEFQKAREQNSKGIEIGEQIHADRMLGYLYAIRSLLDNAEGDFSSAYQSAQLITEIGKRYDYQDLISISLRIIGDIYLLLDNPAKACSYFQKGVDRGGRDFWGLDNLIRLGYAQVRCDQTDIGMVNLHRGIALAKESGFGIIEIQGNQFLCYAQTFTGNWENARLTSDQLEKQTRRRSILLIQVLSQVNQAMSQAKLGEIDLALDQLQFSAGMLADIGYPVVELKTLVQLIKLKRAIAINPEANIFRIHEILANLRKNKKPEQIHEAVDTFADINLAQIGA